MAVLLMLVIYCCAQLQYAFNLTVSSLISLINLNFYILKILKL